MMRFFEIRRLSGLLTLWVYWISGVRAERQIQFEVPSPPLPLPSTGQHLTLSGGFAYVATFAGLTVYDLRDPARPVLTTNIPSLAVAGRGPFSVHVSGRRVYVPGFHSEQGDETNNIAIFELEEPGRLRLAGGVSVGGNPTFCATQGSLLCVAATSNGVYLVDVADAAKPSPVSQVSNMGWSIALHNHPVISATASIGCDCLGVHLWRWNW